jgi:hypothetical protein
MIPKTGTTTIHLSIAFLIDGVHNGLVNRSAKYYLFVLLCQLYWYTRTRVKRRRVEMSTYSRAASRVAMLFVLVCSIVAAAPSSAKAQDSACLEACLDTYEACISNCSQFSGSSRTLCDDNCSSDHLDCVNGC